MQTPADKLETAPPDVAAHAKHPQPPWFVTPVTLASVVAGLALALVMAGSMFWIGSYYTRESDVPPASEIPSWPEVQSGDRSELSSYGWLDRQQDIVRIPIDRAMELLVREASTAEAPASAVNDSKAVRSR